MKEVAKSCPFHFTGADFYALCTDAMLKAIDRRIQGVDLALGASFLYILFAIRKCTF
jgi:peroxin-6